MRVATVRDLGALAREARRRRVLTQAELARAVGVSRDWVVRLERGHPRVETQLVLDTLAMAGVVLTATVEDRDPEDDPFSRVFDGLGDGADRE